MTVADIADFRVLVVPGLHDSGPLHWQTRWQRLYPRFERVTQQQWAVPDLPVWSERVGQVLQQSSRPTLIVAHSFGCLASVHRAASHVPHLGGMLLVAPADPSKFGVSERLRYVSLPCPSIVVGSLDDPWMEKQCAADWAHAWGGQFICAGALGHINAESGLGDWPFGLSLLATLARIAGQPAAQSLSVT